MSLATSLPNRGFFLAPIISFLLLLVGVVPLSGYESVREVIEKYLSKEEERSVEIRSQLGEEESDEIVRFLHGKGIEAKKRQIKSIELQRVTERVWEIYVDEGDAVEAIMLLDEEGLPRKKKSSLFEEFINRQREAVPIDERYRYLADSIRDTIDKLPGVVHSEVLIRPLSVTKGEQVKAVVYIRHDGVLDDPHSALSDEIKSYVLRRVEGLDENDFVFVAEKEIPLHYDLPDLPAFPKEKERSSLED